MCRLTGSLKMNEFADNYPERFFVGIAEANMMGIAAGLTIEVKSSLQHFC